MIRNIAILIANDLALAFKNKSLYLILFIPIFAFIVLQLVDDNNSNIQQINIGLLATGSYPVQMVQALESADSQFVVSRLANETEGKQWLKDGKGDGILVPSEQDGGVCALIVLDMASLKTVTVVESISGLQRVFEGNNKSWISEVRSLQGSGLQRQMLPTWVLMLVLLVGFIIIPTQVAEEKEKKLLLGLLQTPIREVEWLLAKIGLGMILIAVATLLLHLLMDFDFDSGTRLSYIAFLLAGSFCFSSFGILIGFLCRTQASARALGVLIYLPHLLPSALADFSQKLTGVAPFLPSFQLYMPLKSILLAGGNLADFYMHLFILIGIGLVTFALSYQLMKKRWLMG